ncbi:HYC_CC_PP family protein [Plebeiibacterium marinum]|uniref:Uncharacterized protein n=1 Tax=Plebeiibacterium marinum TaxID=2992111 RepID=A0AAE3SJH0_9BACT|nr:hypothetical protein [Plebeiobacterium marinum]MCW3805717.1 hypothetical protein [Plebeiobacterium marinum]
MLRKISHIIFALFLLVSTAGVTLSMHYCGGELVSTSINKEAKSCCDEMGGCCENKTVHFEVEDDYVSPVQVNNVQTLELDILFPILFVLNFDLSIDEEIEQVAFYDSSPPPTIQTRLALLQTYLC